MRLAIGVLVSPGYRLDTDFVFGRPEHQAEGALALMAHIQTGAINQYLPPDKKITGCRTILSRKFPTDVARNEVCESVLKGDEDYLLFLDADMVHPVSMVQRLLNHDKPVITARYHLKKAPFAAVAYVKHPTFEGDHRYITVHFGQGVFEIERCGAGALLIRRDVLEAIQQKQQQDWAEMVALRETFRPAVQDLLDIPPVPTVQWFKYQRGPTPPHDMTVSEDFWFCQQVREAGFSLWCDWDVDVPHIGPMAIDGSFNTPFLHTQVSEYENPEMVDKVLKNTVVLGYDDGMVLGESGLRIPAYQLTPGER